MLTRTCTICCTEFSTYPSRVAAGRGKYCSRKCSDSVTLIQKGQHLSPETEIRKGEPLPESMRLAMVGKVPWNKASKGICKPNSGSFTAGEHRNPATEFKKGDKPPWSGGVRLNMRASKHPNWQGGKSIELYPLGWTRTFREQIRFRDEYTCQSCGLPEAECNRRLSVHHIDCDKENIEPENLVTLCARCHTMVHWQLKGGDADAVSSGKTRCMESGVKS